MARCDIRIARKTITNPNQTKTHNLYIIFLVHIWRSAV